jgi:hypothetical protein
MMDISYTHWCHKDANKQIVSPLDPEDEGIIIF